MLKINEKASCQMINFEKSCITFSLNTREREQRQILDRFGLKCNRAHEYLGLHTVVGRNKKKAFEAIKDKSMEMY